LLLLLLLLLSASQATDLKTKLSKIKIVATASHSVTIALWKETAFPLLLLLLGRIAVLRRCGLFLPTE